MEVLPHPAEAGQALRPAGMVVLRNPLRAFPHPAQGVEPAVHGRGGDGDTILGVECQGKGGTTPACATLAIGLGIVARMVTSACCKGTDKPERSNGGTSCPAAWRRHTKVPAR